MNYYLAEKWVIMICNYYHLEAPVLELGPAAAHVGGVLPHQLRVVTHPAAALLAGPVNMGYCYRIKTYILCRYVETVPSNSMPIAILNVKQYHHSCCMLQ